MTVERLFLAVPQGCLRFVIVVFPDHTHLLFLNFSIFWGFHNITFGGRGYEDFVDIFGGGSLKNWTISF